MPDQREWDAADLTLPQLRMALVEARATLRDAEAGYEVINAVVTQQIVDRAGGEAGLGANVEARKRATLLALPDFAEHGAAVQMVEAARREVEELTALIANAEDERRDVERASRDRLADALGSFLNPTRDYFLTPDLVQAVVDRLAERIRVDMERSALTNRVDVLVAAGEKPSIAHSSGSA